MRNTPLNAATLLRSMSDERLADLLRVAREQYDAVAAEGFAEGDETAETLWQGALDFITEIIGELEEEQRRRTG